MLPSQAEGGNIKIDQQRVNAAVAVVVTNAQRVLFGRRRLANGEFEWQLPGGWIETGESPQQAARREVVEETGLRLQDLRFVSVTNNVFSSHKHSISLVFEAECSDEGELITREYEKCYAWEWRRWDELNDQLFLPLRLLRQSGYRPFLKSDPTNGGSI